MYIYIYIWYELANNVFARYLHSLESFCPPTRNSHGLTSAALVKEPVRKYVAEREREIICFR